MPLNASTSPSTTPRTAPCCVHATSGSLAAQLVVCARAVAAVIANRKRANTFIELVIEKSPASSSKTPIPERGLSVLPDTADQLHQPSWESVCFSICLFGVIRVAGWHDRRVRSPPETEIFQD